METADLHQLLGLDPDGMPDPVTAYELELEEKCPEVAKEISAERYPVSVTAELLQLAIEQIEKVMGEGAAHAYPEVLAAFLRSVIVIRERELRELQPRPPHPRMGGRGEPR
jgi:hypothetical protein